MHIPLRMCVVCRQMKPKSELVRLINADGQITIDKSGKTQTRGVYMCRNCDCIKAGIKRKSLERSFKRAVDISVYEEIEKEITNRIKKETDNG